MEQMTLEEVKTRVREYYPSAHYHYIADIHAIGANMPNPYWTQHRIYVITSEYDESGHTIGEGLTEYGAWKHAFEKISRIVMTKLED